MNKADIQKISIVLEIMTMPIRRRLWVLLYCVCFSLIALAVLKTLPFVAEVPLEEDFEFFYTVLIYF